MPTYEIHVTLNRGTLSWLHYAKGEFSLTNLLEANKKTSASSRNVGKFISHKQVGKRELRFAYM